MIRPPPESTLHTPRLPSPTRCRSKAISSNRLLCSARLFGTALGGLAAPAFAQETAPAETTAPPAETVPQPEAPVTAPPATPPATTAAPPAAILLTPPAPIGKIGRAHV